MYKVKSTPTRELISKYEEAGYFFRFQNPNRRLTSRSKSWGMIYKSAREAEREGCTLLNGKSCVKKAIELIPYASSFSNDYVVLVFQGKERNESGHDGEIVARYDKLIDVFSYDDFLKVYPEMVWA